MSKSVGTGPLSYEKRIYRAAVSQRLRNNALGDLTMCNLAYTAQLLEWERPTPFGQYKNFLYLFIFHLGLKVCLC